jgi:integrase
MASLWRKPHSGVWCITYREDGRQRVRSLRTKNKHEALRLKRAVESALEERGSVALEVGRPRAEAKNPRIGEFWERVYAWALDNRAPNTVKEYAVWFRLLRRFTEAEYVGDITREVLEEWKASLKARGARKVGGLKDVSINNALRTIQCIWSHGLRLGLIAGENPATGVERYKVPVTMDRDYLDEAQVEALLNAAREHAEEKYVKLIEARNVYLAIALMALAGLRKGEACFARWDWMDWEGRVILVTNDEHFTTKNRRPRIISMNTRLMAILAPYRKENGYILESLRTNGGKTPYRVDIKKGFAVICRKAGVKATPHDLRHSFASRHAVAGTSLHVIAGWLGHSTTWVTQRYAHYQKTFNAAADNI